MMLWNEVRGLLLYPSDKQPVSEALHVHQMLIVICSQTRFSTMSFYRQQNVFKKESKSTFILFRSVGYTCTWLAAKLHFLIVLFIVIFLLKVKCKKKKNNRQKVISKVSSRIFVQNWSCFPWNLVSTLFYCMYRLDKK